MKVERTRGSSERETEEVEELASNSRLLDRDQQRQRNFNERGERGFQRNDLREGPFLEFRSIRGQIARAMDPRNLRRLLKLKTGILTMMQEAQLKTRLG